MSKVNRRGLVGLLVLGTIAILLKDAGIIALSWWWVMAPFWLPLAMVVWIYLIVWAVKANRRLDWPWVTRASPRSARPITTFTFDFSRLTAGHLCALNDPDPRGKLWAIHDLTVGGVHNLTMGEFDLAVEQFVSALSRYGVRGKISNREIEAAAEVALRDMLQDIDGL